MTSPELHIHGPGLGVANSCKMRFLFLTVPGDKWRHQARFLPNSAGRTVPGDISLLQLDGSSRFLKLDLDFFSLVLGYVFLDRTWRRFH